ncbi:hypothetical protein BpHYR1_015355 [Brachionus plicatilis]|uniref:Uncharacterized protein n=1 Tax=Brachionus plicatilis TaxID=10195 RepID=A0A3M7T503_BRAPC|nr:hypothetical protein BpHYR1_015355 [Brachionus plicatilis]
MLEQMSDQILGVRTHMVPVLTRKLVDALLDPFEQKLLTLTTLLAPVPSTIRSALARKRHLATQHYVHNDAQTPQVAPLVVRHVVHERLDDLGRQVLGRAYRRAQLRRSDGSGRPAVYLDGRAEIKVAYSHRYDRVLALAQYVLWL